jgi:hypothetical protein
MSGNGTRGHTSLRGRDVGTGKFITVAAAHRRPENTAVERIPDPGFGDESSSLRGRDVVTGHFIPISEARRRPKTTEVVRVPNPQNGR